MVDFLAHRLQIGLISQEDFQNDRRKLLEQCVDIQEIYIYIG